MNIVGLLSVVMVVLFLCYAIYKRFERKQCSHVWIYKGVGGGMGFSWRKIECKVCKSKQESITTSSINRDKYVIGQVIRKADFDLFNSEVR